MAGATLAASLPKLTADLLKCLQDASYQAFKTTVLPGNGVDPTISATIAADMEKQAVNYSTTFASKLAQPLAQAIHSFVSEIGITLIPTGLLMAPQAPAGSLPIVGSASTTTHDFTIM